MKPVSATPRKIVANPRRRSKAAFLAAAFALGLGGCSVLPQRPPPHALSTYRIALPPSTGGKTAVENAVCPPLRVAAPSAAAGFGGPDMRYSETAGTIATFAYHRWAAPPARMLGPLLVQTLSDSGLFETVLAADSPAAAPLQLDTQLVALLQRVDGTQSHVHLVVRSSLSNLRTHRQLAAHRFVIDTPAKAATPEAGVQATDAAIARWNHELVDWLDGVAHTGRCSPMR